MKGIATAHMQLRSKYISWSFLLQPVTPFLVNLGILLPKLCVYGPHGLDYVRLYKGRSISKIVQREPESFNQAEKQPKPPSKKKH